MIGSLCSRRRFLAGIGCSALAVAGQSAFAEPVNRSGGSYLKLSLAAYSFNRHLPRRPDLEKLANAEMTLFDFIDYCAELDLDGCELTGYYFPKTIAPEYIAELKQRSFRQGLDISGTAIGNDFALPTGTKRDAQLAMTREWIDIAAEVGAPVIRIFAGNIPKGDTETAAIERVVAGINESLDHAEKRGVFLALENHGGVTSTADQLLSIVREVRPSPCFGINLDSGNFKTGDPYAQIEQIAPYAVNAQIKVMMHVDGRKAPADLERVVGILKDAGYRGYVVLEYEESEPPRKAIPGYIDTLRRLTRG